MNNTYNRYLWLLNTLFPNKRLTFDEIKHKWDESCLNDGRPLSLRTFHVHRQAVEEMFHLNINCDKSDGYRYYIEDVESVQKDTTNKWLINSFNIVNLVLEGQRMQNRILLEDIPRGNQYLSPIIDAMQNNSQLEILYQPFYAESPALYHVAPYAMKLYHQRWYLLGYFAELDGIRHIALDRVNSLLKMNEGFVYPKDFSPDEYYKNVIGIWTNQNLKVCKVVLRAYGLEGKYLRSLPLHHTQTEICSTDEYVDFEYRLCITTDLVRNILSKGDGIEVIEPEELKTQVLDSVSRIIHRYK